MLTGSWHLINQQKFQQILKNRPDAKVGVTYTRCSQDYAFTEWHTDIDCPLLRTEHTRGLTNLPDYYEWIFDEELSI